MLLFQPTPPYKFWFRTRDRDPELLPLVNRHYYRKATKNPKKGFVGPGRSIVLRTPKADAVFIYQPRLLFPQGWLASDGEIKERQNFIASGKTG